MGIIEGFEDQYKSDSIITEELLNDPNFNPKFYSGRQKQVGDRVLFAFLKKISDNEAIGLEFITIHPDEMGVLYSIDYSMAFAMPFIPPVKKIS